MVGSRVVMLAESWDSSSLDTAELLREPISTALEFLRFTELSLVVLPEIPEISVSLAIRLKVLVLSRTLIFSCSLVRLSTLWDPSILMFSLFSSTVRFPYDLDKDAEAMESSKDLGLTGMPRFSGIISRLSGTGRRGRGGGFKSKSCRGGGGGNPRSRRVGRSYIPGKPLTGGTARRSRLGGSGSIGGGR